MSSGGARIRSGTAKDPNSRRSIAGKWRTLPARPPRRKPPAWPLTEPTDAELDMWAVYWRKPQAEIWRETGMEIEVALHVRHLVEAMQPDANTAARNLVRQQMDSLLLTHKSLSDAMIRIGEPEPVERTSAVKTRPSARERRLAAVPGASA